MAAPAPVYPNGAPVSGVFQSVTSGSSETVVTPTLPGWWTYQPGDEVTLEGELSAQGYRIRSSSAPADQSATPTPDRLVFNAQLVVRHAGDQADELVPLTLVGDQVDVDLIRLDGLHVRVWGRLLSSVEALQRYSNLTGQSFPGLAL